MEKKLALAVFFVDGNRAEIELNRYEDSRLAMSGIYDGSAGQCLSSIADDAGDESDDLNAVVTIWEENHLKPTPDSIFDRAREALERLNGQRLGSIPDVDDAPEIDGETVYSLDVIKRAEIYREAVRFMGVPEDKLDSMDMKANFPEELSNIDADSLAIVEEFVKVRDFNEQGEGYGGDWRYGETLIADSYFEEYAREFAEDIGATKDSDSWPGNCIDWKQAARELQMDYSAIEYDGTTYWIR